MRNRKRFCPKAKLACCILKNILQKECIFQILLYGKSNLRIQKKTSDIVNSQFVLPEVFVNP